MDIVSLKFGRRPRRRRSFLGRRPKYIVPVDGVVSRISQSIEELCFMLHSALLEPCKPTRISPLLCREYLANKCSLLVSLLKNRVRE